MRANWKAIRDENATGTFDGERNSTLSLENYYNNDANGPFFDAPACCSSGSIPMFQVSMDPSLAHGLHIQDRLTEPGIEFFGLESINPLNRQAQDARWFMGSLGPQSAEYAPSDSGLSVLSRHFIKNILTISDTATLFSPSNLDQRADVRQFNYRHPDTSALDHVTFGSDNTYPVHLDLPSEPYQNTPSSDFEDNWGIFLSEPQLGCDSTTAQGGSPSRLGPSETISQATSSGSNPRKSNSPDLGGASQSLKTAVPVIRWPSPESSDQGRGRDPDENHPRRGGRTGSLPPTKRAKVSETRRIGACMFCVLAKVEVLLLLLLVYLTNNIIVYW
jgi:hypothetical protein